MTFDGLDVVRLINKDTAVCKDGDKLFVAKKESTDDISIIEDRIKLIHELSESNFNTPKLYQYRNRNYIILNKYTIYFQEYKTFPKRKQKDSFNQEFLLDAAKIINTFQTITSNKKNKELSCYFTNYYSGKLKNIISNGIPSADNEILINYLTRHLENLDKSKFVVCHGSFRHHNLFYDLNGHLNAVDFFHEIYYAPKAYDICLLFSQFSLASKLFLPKITASTFRSFSTLNWVYNGFKWGFYSEKLIEKIFKEYNLGSQEENEFIPTFYISQLKFKNYLSLINSKQYLSFISAASNVLGADKKFML